jgi:hypothetical protein
MRISGEWAADRGWKNAPIRSTTQNMGHRSDGMGHPWC